MLHLTTMFYKNEFIGLVQSTLFLLPLLHEEQQWRDMTSVVI